MLDIPWSRGVRDGIETQVTTTGAVQQLRRSGALRHGHHLSAVIDHDRRLRRCLSQMLMADERYRDQSMAVWSGTSMAPIFAGTSQHGFLRRHRDEPPSAAAAAAHTYDDGVDTAGIVFGTTPNHAQHRGPESEYPVLYLFRRHLRDSGGPGRYRGGRSAELAYAVHKAPDNRLDGLFAGTGAEMPNAIGIGGRHAWCGNPHCARRRHGHPRRACATAHLCPTRWRRSRSGLEILPPKHMRSSMDPGDVWYHSWQAGGGYGDPLRRDPERVAMDVEAQGRIGGRRGGHLWRGPRRRWGLRRDGRRGASRRSAAGPT